MNVQLCEVIRVDRLQAEMSMAALVAVPESAAVVGGRHSKAMRTKMAVWLPRRCRLTAGVTETATLSLSAPLSVIDEPSFAGSGDSHGGVQTPTRLSRLYQGHGSKTCLPAFSEMHVHVWVYVCMVGACA